VQYSVVILLTVVSSAPCGLAGAGPSSSAVFTAGAAVLRRTWNSSHVWL